MRLTEKEILVKLKNICGEGSPIEICDISPAEDIGFMAEFRIRQGPSFSGIVEIASLATPKMVKQKISVLRDFTAKAPRVDGCTPILVAPYIGNKQAEMLESNDISWIDLSGNMKMKSGKTIYIERRGNPNAYPDTAAIKKIYIGASSLVSRALLLKPEGFTLQKEILEFIRNRNADITLATVSKVLKTLEDELLVEKGRDAVRPVDRLQILENLKNSYANSMKAIKQRQCQYFCGDISMLTSVLSSNNIDYAACRFYAAQLKGLAVTEMQDFYVKDLDSASIILKAQIPDFAEDREYGNVMLTEMNNASVWFNIGGKPVKMVDDIELYLEMSVATPRGPKVAEKLKERILQKQ